MVKDKFIEMGQSSEKFKNTWGKHRRFDAITIHHYQDTARKGLIEAMLLLYSEINGIRETIMT